jgi:catechol-2,3-dioxygenase
MIEGINHYNLRSDEVTMNTLKDFYIKVVGLSLGERPPFKSKGFWLNAEGKDILHLSCTKNGGVKDHHVNSTFDHLAFSASNMTYYEKILTDNKINYSYREVPEIGTKQLFFKDPVGNGIELIFI